MSEIRSPNSAAANPAAALFAVGCAGRSCLAAGPYAEAAGPDVSMSVGSAGGHWAASRELRLSGGAAGSQNYEPAAVACTAAGYCVVAGEYTRTGGGQSGFIDTESAGKWRGTVTPALPANAAADHQAGLSGVSCPRRGYCAATGSYTTSTDQNAMLAVTETRGHWARAVEVRPPSGAATPLNAYLDAVSCTAAGDCVAVGAYATRSGDYEAMAVTESRGSWARAARVAPPAGAAADPLAALNDVSCSSTGNCVAVGSYYAGTHTGQAFTVTDKSGRWGAASRVRLPSDSAASPDAFLTGITCPAARTCLAVGGYTAKGTDRMPFRVAEARGRWARAAAVGLPANALAGSGRFGLLDAVSCGQGGLCTAVGLYYQTATVRQALAAAIPAPSVKGA